MSEQTDAELLAAHCAGDPDAFSEIVRRHRDRLWAVALRTTGNPEEASDALQDALISAYRRADSFRGDSAVTTWLHRIVVNASLDRLRRRAVRTWVPLPEEGEGATLVDDSRLADPGAAAESRETVAEVREFLQNPVHFFAECQAVNAFENLNPYVAVQFGSALIVLAIITGVAPWLWAACGILFVQGLTLFFMGLQGMYLGRMYDEVKGRPLYIVSEKHNLD